jgi:hypothetical protein
MSKAIQSGTSSDLANVSGKPIKVAIKGAMIERSDKNLVIRSNIRAGGGVIHRAAWAI